MSCPEIPEKRCAVVVRNKKSYLLVAVPKPEPPPPRPLENLMFFDQEPSKPQTETKPVPADIYLPGSHWQHGYHILTLEVTPNGEIRRSTDFSLSEYTSFKEVFRTCGPFESITEYATVFGAVLLDRIYVLVASKAHCAVRLPHGATIWKVDETQWIPFNLEGVAPIEISTSDRGRLREFQEYSYYKGYYYSDYVDLRQLFPFSVRNQDETLPNLNCDWSAFLRTPFKTASLKFSCSLLVRGFAEERILKVGESELHMILLGRQNNVNPGPRYIGRGLNEENGAGNDHIYEYILWKDHGPDALAFTRHVFLRGTIPVRWKTQSSSVSLSEPSMIFSPNNNEVVRGCDQYFLNTFTTLQRTMNTDSNKVVQRNPQLRCISLLRLNSQHGEDVLAQYFSEGIRMAKPVVMESFPQGTLDLASVDWLNTIKEYGIEAATKTFWESSLGFLGKSSSSEDSLMSLGMIRTDGSVDRLVSQTRFVRINCADSLDRTNLGCYFTCLQVSIAMLLTLQVPFGAFEDKRPIPPLQDIEDGDYGSTLYSDPVPGAKQVVPQPYLNVWNDARNAKRVPAAIVRTLAEIFAHNGDCVAMLYTSSAAMHGNILRGVADMKMGSHNAVIATQRKYENAFEDGKKFRSIEILLGRNLDVHYKSFSPIYLTRPIPYNRWNTALVVQSLPADCTSDDVDKAIRSCWDQGVIPQLLANNIAPIESSALCLVISLQSRNSKDSEVATVVEQSIPTSSPSTSEGGRFPQTSNSGGLAVVEFDENLCSVVNAPALLRQQGCLIVNGCRCIMASYAYPINFNGDNSGNGYVKQVGTSLKKGFKTFMRNL